MRNEAQNETPERVALSYALISLRAYKHLHSNRAYVYRKRLAEQKFSFPKSGFIAHV